MIVMLGMPIHIELSLKEEIRGFTIWHRPLAILYEVFWERLIGHRYAIEWTAGSPDLSPCDFFVEPIEKYSSHRQMWKSWQLQVLATLEG